MASNDLLKETLICSVVDKIFLNSEKCTGDVTKLSTASPCLVLKGSRHLVKLWGQEVGLLGVLVSETIIELSKLKFVKLQMYVYIFVECFRNESLQHIFKL